MDASAWTGPVGNVWASEWRRTDQSFADLSSHLNAAIVAHAPDHGRAFDIGCGAGATTIALAAARPALAVIGIDLSPALISVARSRASDFTNVSFEAGSVETVLPQVGKADLLCSRHGVMFFDDPAAAMSILRAAAAPGAWLVFSCFQNVAQNAWAREVVAAVAGDTPPVAGGYVPGPFAFGDAAFVYDIVTSAGWTAGAPVAVDFDYAAGEGADPVMDAVDYFTRIGPAASLFRGKSAADSAAAKTRLQTAVERRLVDGKVIFPAAAWVWSMQAL